jgi:MFS family permease
VLRLVTSLFTLLSGMTVLLIGVGLLSTLLGVRAQAAGMSSGTIGLVMAAYFAGFVIGTYWCPAIIRRVGHIRAFTAFAAISAAVAVGHALWLDAWFWGALRLINGIMMVGLYMTMESWLNTAVDNSQRGSLFAVYVTLSLLAMSLGQFLLMLSSAQGFALFALVSILFSMGLVPIALTRVQQPTPVETPTLHLRQLIGFSPLGTFGTLIAGLTSGAFWGLGAVFAKALGLSPFHIAAFMGATIAGGALLQWPIGKFSDRFDRRNVMLAVCAAGALLASSITVATHLPLPVLLALSFLYGGVAFTLYGISVAHMNDQIRVEDMLEASSGLLLIYGVGAVIGPMVGGQLMTRFGPASLFIYFAAALALLGLFGLHRSRVTEPTPLEEQGEFVPMVRTSQAAIDLSHPEAQEAAADEGEVREDAA